MAATKVLLNCCSTTARSSRPRQDPRRHPGRQHPVGLIGGIALAIEMGIDAVDIDMSYQMLGDKAQAPENLQAGGMTLSLRPTLPQATSILNGWIAVATRQL